MKNNVILRSTLVLSVALVALLTPLWVQAQDVPRQRDIRGYVPPDQLVSFRPETPFTQFIDFVNPIFERVDGKQVIDPESRQFPIGVSVAGLQYFDAFELVLSFNRLTYRETDRFYIVEEVQEEAPIVVQQAGAALAETPLVPATLDTREIQINALLFSINRTKARDVGIDWNVFFGGETASSGGGGQGFDTGADGESGSSSGLGGIPRFFLKTDNIADAVDNYLIMPDQFDVATLTRFFRFLETEGVGETMANPRVTVQSGEQGRIQIGTDFPFVTRDFSGNTLTQFVSTGIIINVTPTLITEALVDTVGAPTLDFIHLNIQVENSNGQISQAGPIVDRNSTNTQVLLLDNESTIIGGLYSTDEVVNRRGIPILKDLPGWFFGIRYLTGVTQRTTIQTELLIVLQAKLVDPLRARAGQPFKENLLEERRRQIRELLRRLDTEMPAQTEFEERN